MARIGTHKWFKEMILEHSKKNGLDFRTVAFSMLHGMSSTIQDDRVMGEYLRIAISVVTELEVTK